MPNRLVVRELRSLKDHIGRPLGPSDWVTVSRKKIELFADATGDHQWIHLDEERAARESPFGGTIAHGYLTLSLAPRLLEQLLQVEGVALTINYGIEKMRLTAPVPAGSRVRLVGSIRSVRETPGGAVRVGFQLSLELEGSTKPACSGEVVFVYLPERGRALPG
jgi:acyl dehydratase